MPDHKVAVQMILNALVDKDHGVISDVSEIAAVGHRVLHGGKFYSASVIVNDDVKKVIRDCFPLGPLHNPANLIGIEACEDVLPAGCGFRYCIPSDNARKGIHIRSSL